MNILIISCLLFLLNERTLCDVDNLIIDKDSTANERKEDLIELSPGTLKVLDEWKQSQLENEAESVDYPSSPNSESGDSERDTNSSENGRNGQQKWGKPRVSCIQHNQDMSEKNGDNLRRGNLALINGTELQVRMAEETNCNVTNRTAPGICSVILFYGNWCQFSAKAAPSFNALPRYFTTLNFYAIEVANNLNIFSQYAVVALPSVLVFHNGKPVYGFNSSSHTLETYIQFIHNNTGIKYHQSIPIELIQEDYKGPVPINVVEKFNYNLLVAYLFILLCLLINLSKCSFVTNLTDTLRHLWREVQIEHEHAD